MRVNKKLKALTITFIAGGTFGLLLTFLLWTAYSTYLPRTPDPATGRIYRLAQHGLMVYQTRREHLLYWGVLDCSVVLCVLGGFGIVMHDWMSDKLSGR
jgi:hypothetical protein